MRGELERADGAVAAADAQVGGPEAVSVASDAQRDASDAARCKVQARAGEAESRRSGALALVQQQLLRAARRVRVEVAVVGIVRRSSRRAKQVHCAAARHQRRLVRRKGERAAQQDGVAVRGGFHGCLQRCGSGGRSAKLVSV
jgi:hypothetical protein